MSATGSFQFMVAASLTSTRGVVSIEEIATIMGGTGRFAGATGGFTVGRSVDTMTLPTSGSFNGTISSH
jgi:hypothetical protein